MVGEVTAGVFAEEVDEHVVYPPFVFVLHFLKFSSSLRFLRFEFDGGLVVLVDLYALGIWKLHGILVEGGGKEERHRQAKVETHFAASFVSKRVGSARAVTSSPVTVRFDAV